MSSRRVVAVVRTVLSDTPGACCRSRSSSAGRNTISPMSVMPMVIERVTLAGSNRLCWLMPPWIMPSA
jgi:ABC-type spermidine/putrescine transport system permease subunit II